MTTRERQTYNARLTLWRGLCGVSAVGLVSGYEQLLRIVGADPLLGDQWLERQLLALQDVRDWLARLEGGDDA